MGCLFAARLARAGLKVYLVDHRRDRAERLARTGITLEQAGKSTLEHPEVSTHIPNGLNLIMVLTKAYSTPTLRFPAEIPVLTLQNGLGNAEAISATAGSARLLAGVTTEAATLVGEGHVRHVAEGITSFGAWTSCPSTPAARILEQAGFKVRLTDSPGQLLWEKVAINAGINPLTALLNVPNGRLLELREARQLMRDLVVEAAKTAATEGYRFDHSLIELTEETCRQTGENISSMLQDIRAGRPTEIGAISGEILRRSQRASLPTPRTRVIYQLVKGLESR
jgi:2-dehydropantoate 2-reductase